MRAGRAGNAPRAARGASASVPAARRLLSPCCPLPCVRSSPLGKQSFFPPLGKKRWRARPCAGLLLRPRSQLGAHSPHGILCNHHRQGGRPDPPAASSCLRAGATRWALAGRLCGACRRRAVRAPAGGTWASASPAWRLPALLCCTSTRGPGRCSPRVQGQAARRSATWPAGWRGRTTSGLTRVRCLMAGTVVQPSQAPSSCLR